jgi:hypothetical protein
MATRTIEEALINPGRVFGRPANVVRDGHLDKAEQLLILDNWALDLAALTRADDENMTVSGADVPAAEMLQQINDARRQVLRKPG